MNTPCKFISYTQIISFFRDERKVKEPGRCWYYLGNNRVNTLKEALE